MNKLRRTAIGLLALSAASQTACDDFLAAHYRPDEPVVAQHAATNPARRISDVGLLRLRTCESHGNYRIVNSTGTYRGAYQFSRRTWNNVARTILPQYVGVDPASAPTYIQDAMARALWAMTGPSSWPVCGYRV